MSLKQECIDIINLITEPLKKDEYDLYEIETDSIRDNCQAKTLHMGIALIVSITETVHIRNV